MASYFNPRFHERSDECDHSRDHGDCDFNPRFHERSDRVRFAVQSMMLKISIHASTRGATQRHRNSQRSKKFQSTLPREERHKDQNIQISVWISIHASTRGATQADASYCTTILFQSTLPREERLNAGKPLNQKQLNFNPRFHERSDGNIAQKICLFLYNTDNKYIIR